MVSEGRKIRGREEDQEKSRMKSMIGERVEKTEGIRWGKRRDK